MKAIVYEKFNGPLHVKNVQSPKVENHGVIIQIKATGMCLSDWHGWKGHDQDIELPQVPGHELAGEIVELGKSVKNFSIGDRVTVPFVCACGSCYECYSGNQQVCDNQSQPGFTQWGSFAEYMEINHADLNLVKIPDEISNETASLLGCRFTTSFRAVVAQGKVRGGMKVAVHGCGGVGLSAIMIAKALGAQVIAIDINQNALDYATRIGAEYVINAKETADVVQEVHNWSCGGVNVSLDAIGNKVTCFNSIANLKKRGKHIQVGLMTGNDQHPKIPMDLVVAKELEVIGSHGMQAYRFQEIFDMIQTGAIKPELLLEKTVSLEEGAKLLPLMDQFGNPGVTVINQF